jgi:hypothetical protein
MTQTYKKRFITTGWLLETWHWFDVTRTQQETPWPGKEEKETDSHHYYCKIILNTILLKRAYTQTLHVNLKFQKNILFIILF